MGYHQGQGEMEELWKSKLELFFGFTNLSMVMIFKQFSLLKIVHPVPQDDFWFIFVLFYIREGFVHFSNLVKNRKFLPMFTFDLGLEDSVKCLGTYLFTLKTCIL